MSYKMTCPYCFGRFADEEVLFRSEYVAREGDILALVPEDYEDLEDFLIRYHGADKDEILQQCRDLEFFVPKNDDVYESFWAHFGGTTEYDPADGILGVAAYHRPIIDPRNPDHQRYLESQADGGYFLYDADGMAVQIKLKRGERCSKRVCPHCHNPLPDGYGKNPVKFVSVIGATGAGKTVYLSQLIRDMLPYADKVGLTAITNPGVREFLKNNSIEAGRPLPAATPFDRFQQPLFVEPYQQSGGTERWRETLVLYDVPGEVLTDGVLVDKFAPFVEHSDGILLLVDPLQIGEIHVLSSGEKQLDDPTTLLNVLYSRIVPRANAKCSIPVAVCLAKADRPEVMNVLPPELWNAVRSDYQAIRGSNGFPMPLFNGTEYNPIFKGLFEFYQATCPQLSQMMYNNFATYGYFVLTALGCPVEGKKDDRGNILYQYPVGPVIPKRVEEPLLWLFHQFGYIGVTDGGIVDVTAPPISCPGCGRDDQVVRLPEGSTTIIEGGHWPFKRRREVPINYECRNCGLRWFQV